MAFLENIVRVFLIHYFTLSYSKILPTLQEAVLLVLFIGFKLDVRNPMQCIYVSDAVYFCYGNQSVTKTTMIKTTNVAAG